MVIMTSTNITVISIMILMIIVPVITMRNKGHAT